MGWEIERRFLVRVSEALWPRLGPGRHLRQGYVTDADPTIRIRVGEERGAVLACKSGSGIRRSESEVVVPPEVAEALFVAAGDRVIEKIRWRIGAWELDRFLGALEGLTLLEVELEAEDAVLPAPPEGVHVLREVTDDKRFVSAHLASMPSSKRQRMVSKAYKEVKGWTGLNA